MKPVDDFLVEIHTEELPPKSLLKLGEAFSAQIAARLQKSALTFSETTFFVTPRRLAVLVKNLAAAQPDQTIERKGPTLQAAFDAAGNPTKACLGFARSVGVSPEALLTIKNHQGEWVGVKQNVLGKSTIALLPAIVDGALAALPIQKRMRWGQGETLFVRTVHAVIMLYGDQVVESSILGMQSGRVTRGHRFLAPDWLTIPHASLYPSLLYTAGFVMADFAKRREKILQDAQMIVQTTLGNEAHCLLDDALVNEVTGLVEWPVALCGRFDAQFLALPQAVLISAMSDHQRYFPVVDAHGKLLPHFVFMSNIEPAVPARVVHGNERVLRARLADAQFFFATDKKERLADRVNHLRGMVFQAKLGTLFDKTERIQKLAAFVAKKIGKDVDTSARAALLAKTDLTTQMVGEFPELQGIMGYYYALHDGESNDVAIALKEQYMPRFAGDEVPKNPIGQILALVDRIDTLTGAFGIFQIPTGDKDPYGLRRAAIGVLRILIENNIDLDLKDLIELTIKSYAVPLENPDTCTGLLTFLQERLRAWYQDQGIEADVFAAVAALGIHNPLDVHSRMKAVQAFKKLNEAEALSIANKRVSNILAQYADKVQANHINPTLFESAAEQELAQQLEKKSQAVAEYYQHKKYDKVLLQLAELSKPIDNFFDQVMVMTEDKPRRENRILLLNKLRSLFLQVADIALLQ